MPTASTNSAAAQRQETLDRLKSPDDLDRLMVVISGRTWLAFAGVVVFCFGFVIWSCVAAVPVSVEGFGILIAPGNVRTIHSTGAMQLEWKVREGQHVEKHEVLAVATEPDDSEVRFAEARQAAMAANHKQLEELDRQREESELASIRKKRSFVAEQMEKESQLNSQLTTTRIAMTKQQRENLAQSKLMAENLNEAFKRRSATIKELQAQGLASGETVLAIESSLITHESKLADLQVQIKQLELADLEEDRKGQVFSARMTDLELQRLELDLQETKLVQSLFQNRIMRKGEKRALDEKLEQARYKLGFEKEIISIHSGRILSLSVPSGAEVKNGAKVALIAVDSPNNQLKNLSYFSVKDGKQLKVGDPVYVTPATIERERYGSIKGRVTRISSFPVTQESAASMIGNDQLAAALLKQGGAIEVEMDLEQDPSSQSGFRWTGPGPDLTFSAGTTTISRATIEERLPITFVLPFLRTWLYGEKDDVQPKL